MRRLSENYPLQRVCAALGFARSAYDHRGHAPDEGAWRAAIVQAAGTWLTYGYRRIPAQLRREPFSLGVHRQRARRGMGGMGLLRPTRPKTRRTTDSAHDFPRSPQAEFESQWLTEQDGKSVVH